MSKYQELLQREADLQSELAALRAVVSDEGRKLTAEERDRRNEIMSELPDLKGDIEFAQQQREEERRTPRGGNPEWAAEEDAGGKPVEAKGPQVFPTLGHQLAAIYQSSQGDATARAKLMAAATGAGEAIDSDGGHLLQDVFALDIERKMHEVGVLLGLVSPLEISGARLVTRFIDETNRADGSRWGAIRGYWVEEGDAITASRPKFGRLSNELHKIAALGYSTDELLQDVPAMTGIFSDGFAEELAFKVEDAIVEGDGAGKPLGFNIAANPSLIAITKETNQAADTIVTTNLAKMWQRLPARHRPTTRETAPETECSHPPSRWIPEPDGPRRRAPSRAAPRYAPR